MATQSTRQLIVEALQAANVPGVGNHSRIASFLAGEGEVELAELDFDSLGAMEFCIHIEVHHGLSLLPDRLREIATLGQLAEMMEGKLG